MHMIGNGAFANSLEGLKQRIDHQHKIVNYLIIDLRQLKDKITDFSNVLDLMTNAKILIIEKYSSPKC